MLVFASLVVEMFKAHLVMIQRKSANPYARETEKGQLEGLVVPSRRQPLVASYT